MNAPDLSDIACLNLGSRGIELKSTIGYHCDVWQMTMQRRRGRPAVDLVIKKYRAPCGLRQVRVLDKDYRRLKSNLEDIIPDTVFVAVNAARGRSVIAICRAVVPWFNLANPINEDDAVPLLRTLPKARNQLLRFVHAARKWSFEKHGKIIDLYGLDNLVLDTNREVRYLDSFHVFFYLDMHKYVDAGADDSLLYRMQISRNRCEYLEHLMNEVGGA